MIIDKGRRSTLRSGAAIALGSLAMPFITTARAQALTPLNLTIQFVPRGDFATYYLARERGYYKERGLDVTLKHVLGNALAFQSLSAGNCDVVHADILQMIQLQGKSPDPQMRSIGVVAEKLHISLFYLKGRGIEKPSDLVGRTIVDSPGSTAPQMFSMFAKANNFDPSKVTWKSAAGNAKVALMLQGEADFVAIGLPALPGMQARLPPGKEVGYFTFGDHGVNIYGDGLITTDKSWRGRQDIMKAFVQATMKGCKDAFADPAAGAAAMCKYYPEMDQALAVKELALIRDVAVGKPQREHGLGYHDPVKFKATEDAVITLLAQPVPKPYTDYYSNDAIVASII